MRNFVRISIAAAIAVSLGFVWTVGQGGLLPTNRNLCELWASLPLPRYESCEFQNVLVDLWLLAAVIGVIWLLIEFCRLAPVRARLAAFFLIVKRSPFFRRLEARWVTAVQRSKLDPIIGIGIALITVGLIVFAVRVSSLSAARPIVGTFLNVGGPPKIAHPLLPDDGGAIKWVGDFLFSASSSPAGPTIGGIQATGENKSDEFVGPLSGFVRSEITGQQFPMLINDSSGKNVSLDGYGIPAGNQFRIFAPLRNGGVPLSVEEFVRDFSRFTFVFQYGNHTYTRRFTPDEVQKETERVGAFLTPKPNTSRVGARQMPSKEDAR